MNRPELRWRRVLPVAVPAERLRSSGLPIYTHRERDGGGSIPKLSAVAPITFDLPEAAALVSSLSTCGWGRG